MRCPSEDGASALTTGEFSIGISGEDSCGTHMPSITRRRFRADAAFAIPALFDLLGAEGWDYVIRI